MPTVISLLVLCVSVSSAANILGIFTSTGPSHLIIHMATAKALAERGHNVTVVTSLPLKERHANIHHIYVPPSEEEQADYRRALSDAATNTSAFKSLRLIFSANVQRVRMQDKALRHPRFQELMNNTGNRFDIAVLGLVFNTFQLGVAAHFKCPVIVSWVNAPSPGVLSLVGNPLAVSSAYVFPGRPAQLTEFRARVENFLVASAALLFTQFSDYKMSQFYEEHFPAERYPSYEEMKENVSLVLCSTHFSEGSVRPMVPGLIEVGGIQIKDEPDPLPKDLQSFLRNADDGFILFSLGTNVQTTDLSENTTSAIFSVLSRVSQKVLWKWDHGKPPGRSPNIMFRKWFPQDDLLAHPRIRLFITHAGKGSTVEAQYHGVPMLAMPVFGDQHAISRRLEQAGHGLVVNHRNLTEAHFGQQLQEVLRNTSYLAAVLKFSMLYRDRPMSAKQSVVYWTEYVIRHRGARHIQSPAVHLNFFQRHSLDVMGFIALVLYVGARLLAFLFSLTCRRKLKVE